MKKIILLTSMSLFLSACSNDVVTSKKIESESTTTSSKTTEEKVEEKTSKKESIVNSSANIIGSLSPMQSERLANGMVDFGRMMGQYPYIKTDTPSSLTWETGGEVSGYTIFESYIYQNGPTTHRYFFVLNPSGATEVLYSTGGTIVRPTANFDIHAIFGNAYGNSGAATALVRVASNSRGYLSHSQASSLAQGMVNFGREMGQTPYVKTDVPLTLTWETGGSVSGYTVYESYIYHGGGTTHRYFFVMNPSGNPEVLYSTGGTVVKPTVNVLITMLFSGMF